MNLISKFKNKIFLNSIWIILEKLIALFGLIFVTSFVAKYIGPESFGKLSFATTIFAVVQTLAIWGTDVICSKRIAQNHDSGLRLLKSISLLRAIVFFVTSIPLLIYMWIETDYLSFIFALAVGVSAYISVQDIYILYNDVTLKAIYNVFANIIGLIVSLILRFIIAYFELDVIYLVFPIILIALIPFFIRRYIFNKNNKNILSFNKIKSRIKYSKYVLRSGSSLVLSALAITVYVNVSQFLLGVMISKKSLGIFTVGVTLGSAWSFVNNAFLTSFTPKLYQSKNNVEASLVAANISRIMTIFFIIYLVAFYFIGEYLIQKLYGNEYIEAFNIALILVVSTFLSNLGQVYARYMFLYNGFNYLMYKTFILVVFGVFIAYVLIDRYQMYGAAIAVLIVELFSLTLFNYLFKKFEILKAQLVVFGLKRKLGNE
ncbi:oligosaccharide flippase family protein [Acinetobacter soli]|uniref:oligosaccharide flippase family protein n=1 Tax=Acinetobacter soli TaxID=487316 RepID=UPI000DD0D4E9|nr:oligosaccharide flippase family protein [Acinetobacter soli]MCE6008180.1 oligosaccharide flippase family protein [Acinetobacter soli]MDQ9833125.1 oligosaccharide flippase family protein [Acinetobacter soli]RSB53242.1 polysaccharide biosynthesis protein [Acinetobacter soli]